MEFFLLFLIAGLSVVGFIIGYGVNSSDSLSPPGRNDEEVACREGCEQLQQRRSNICLAAAESSVAQAAQARAKNAHDAVIALLAVAVITAAALWAATTVPLFGLATLPFAIAATVTATALAISEAVALGALLGANTRAAQAANNEALARRREQEAIQILRNKCSPEEVDACLARPRPC